MKLLLRILIPAVALGVAHLLISGIELTGNSDAKKIGTARRKARRRRS